VVSRPSEVRRKPKAPNEAPTYKKVMVALKPGFFNLQLMLRDHTDSIRAFGDC